MQQHMWSSQGVWDHSLQISKPLQGSFCFQTKQSIQLVFHKGILLRVHEFGRTNQRTHVHIMYDNDCVFNTVCP